MNMRRFTSFLIGVLGMLLLGSAAVAQESTSAVSTNAPTIEAAVINFRVKDLKIVKMVYDDEFPDIKSVKGGPRLEWLMIRVEYEWKLDAKAASKKRSKPQKQGDGQYWLDELEFDWRVVIAQPAEGNAVRSTSDKGSFNVKNNYAVRMSKKVKYTDVNDDGDHVALIFVEGRALKRHVKRMSSSLVFCDLRIKLNGRELGRLSSHGEKYYFAQRDEDNRNADKDERERAKYMPRRNRRDASFFESDKVKSIDYALRNRMESPWRWNKEGGLETIVEATKD